MTDRPLCLLMILDGWGVNRSGDGNAVAIARTPVLDRLSADYPRTELTCSGTAVGLPDGIMGNSEVGHLNMGAGRIVYQDLLRIDTAIANGSFFENEGLAAVMDRVRSDDRSLHLMGLVSDGGVHSQFSHILALLEMARQRGLTRVCIHAILDGRDTPPDSGVGYLRRLQTHLEAVGVGRIATVCGRYYAMDRDRRWDRTERAYRLYTRGDGIVETDPVAAVTAAYGRNETDEFVPPITICPDGRPAAAIEDGDGVIFFNFRADRARQITRAFTQTDFSEFLRPRVPQLCGYVGMTRYDETFDLPAAFPPVHHRRILGEVLSENGLRQLRIAETEKYAHVTYFFNGGEERAFALEDRCLIPSPRDVATYDQKPEMSAVAVTDEVIERIRSGRYDVIVLNFANMDMVGHTGILDAAVTACETVDGCVGRIVSEIRDRNGVALVTADHGNAEQMRDEDGHPHTAHTVNRVPFILVDDRRRDAALREGGKLADIAPTLLWILGLAPSDEMTGRSLIE